MISLSALQTRETRCLERAIIVKGFCGACFSVPVRFLRRSGIGMEKVTIQRMRRNEIGAAIIATLQVSIKVILTKGCTFLERWRCIVRFISPPMLCKCGPCGHWVMEPIATSASRPIWWTKSRRWRSTCPVGECVRPVAKLEVMHLVRRVGTVRPARINCIEV